MGYIKINEMKKGFTLIELLIVIAIIGVLSSIVISALNSSRDKARIAKVQLELKQFQNALYLYYNTNNTFPCFNEGAVSACLIPALASFGNLPTKDPWGVDYQWHNPGCCTAECTMVVSAGLNKVIGGTGDIGVEHIMSQTSNCTKTDSSYDDIGIYFGQVKDNL
jgi:general secretion pathway protein G